MKSAFDEFISGLNMAKEGISELEGRQYKLFKLTCKRKVKNVTIEHPGTVGQFQMV